MEQKRFFCDMHVHSENSHDSRASVMETAEVCAERGIGAFAVTDHFDPQYYIERQVEKRIASSFRQAKEAAIAYDGRVRVLAGIELGESLWEWEKTQSTLRAYDFDAVIGSVHAVRYEGLTTPYSRIDFSVLSREVLSAYLEAYFNDLEMTLAVLNCDIAAHITCPYRYINGKYGRGADTHEFAAHIERILDIIVQRGMALEVNTSGGFSSLMPNEWILRRYREKGGEKITLGSDAHLSEDVGKDFAPTLALLDALGFAHYGYYESRAYIPVKI